MTFLNHEHALISKLKETNYDMFDGDKNEAFEFLADRYGKFVNYANTVINEQIMQPIIYSRHEGQNLRDRIEAMDKQRRYAHDAAIDSVNILNRMSARLGIEPFSTVDTSDRHAVADMVGDYIGELYKTGTKGMDGATFRKDHTYNTSVIADRIKQAEALSEGIADGTDNQFEP